MSISINKCPECDVKLEIDAEWEARYDRMDNYNSIDLIHKELNRQGLDYAYCPNKDCSYVQPKPL